LSHSQQRVPLGLDGLDLFEKQFEPIELTVDERFKMRREGPTITGLEFCQPFASVAAQRLISGYALAE
jgi:hypothetical protein